MVKPEELKKLFEKNPDLIKDSKVSEKKPPKEKENPELLSEFENPPTLQEVQNEQEENRATEIICRTGKTKEARFYVFAQDRNGYETYADRVFLRNKTKVGDPAVYDMNMHVQNGTVLKVFAGFNQKRYFGIKYLVVDTNVDEERISHPYERQMYIEGPLRIATKHELPESSPKFLGSPHNTLILELDSESEEESPF